MNILDRIGKELLYFDGGMGTMLQARGLQQGELPEMWNLTHPEILKDIHLEYLNAGCHIINTNTFGANGLKYNGKNGKPSVEEIVGAAVENVRAAIEESGRTDAYVSLDIGPTGKLLEPFGDLPFEDAVDIFAEIVDAGVKYGADVITIETMNDSYETKAAVLAAKEHSDLPVFVTNVYDARGKLMTGAEPEAMIALLEGLKVNGLGMNCSLGPAQMLELVPVFAKNASVPVIVTPNAGLPRTENGRACYDITPEQFAQYMVQIVSRGAQMIGGCCGTTPEYMRQVIKATKGMKPVPLCDKEISMVSSYTHAVTFSGRPVLIGERINPTGKKEFQKALREDDIDYILDEGLAQKDAGADILDVNVGLPEIDEEEMMTEAVNELQTVLDLPLQIDTTDPVVMEKALRIYNGKAMINSVNGKIEVMEKVFPIAAKYGGLIVALTLDEDGIPETVQGRLMIAEKIYRTAERYGISRKDIIIDPLALAISADDHSAMVTLETVKRIHEEFHGNTILGVSNISFGLPRRKLINGVFFSMALQAGLRAAILNPFSEDMMNSYRCYLALSGQDQGCTGYISYTRELAERENRDLQKKNEARKEVKTQDEDPEELRKRTVSGKPLVDAIISGLKEQAAGLTKELLENNEPLTLVSEQIVPALDFVGKGFEEKRMYLPQLLMSAEAAKSAFELVNKKILESSSGKKEGKKIVLATVKGDIHDIGKNIVKVLLENYGFSVIDLGRDVPVKEIVKTVQKENAGMCGLSALMTTTVSSMEETAALLRKEAPWCRIVVGGAVLTQEYADKIHADKYAKDAMETVRYALDILKDEIGSRNLEPSD